MVSSCICWRCTIFYPQVSTPAHLDVKMRVASGLSKEGWNIIMNLLTEITILTLGFFLGIVDSSIQEFCLLAVMALLSDLFLQSFLFATILSMDMGSQGLSDDVVTGRRREQRYKRKDIFQVRQDSMINTNTCVQHRLLAPCVRPWDDNQA